MELPELFLVLCSYEQLRKNRQMGTKSSKALSGKLNTNNASAR